MTDAKVKRGGFFRGMGFVGRGLGFVLSNKSLWPWVAAPVLLTALVTILSVWGVFRWGDGFVERHAAGHFFLFAWLLKLVLYVLLVGVAFVAVLVTSSVATAPFAGTLSEKTERLATGQAPTQHGVGAILRESLRSTAHTIVVMLIYLPIAAALFLIQFFVAPLAPFVWIFSLWVTGTVLAYDAFDLPLSRRDKKLGEKWAYLRAHKGDALGFGVAVALLLCVPGFGFFIPAVAAVGGTLLYVEIEKG
jgi:CysZ protein